jgi:translation initiation factor 1
MGNSRFVYSTETGRMCPVCNRPASRCTCKSDKLKVSADGKTDGVLRIKHEVKGRKGKAVTTISGFEESEGSVKSLASELKSSCGTGGSVKDGVIIIQGDHRETLKMLLEQKGFKVKLAGG